MDVPPSPKVHAREAMVPSLSVELSVKLAVRPLVTKLKLAVGATLPPPPWVRIACEMAQLPVSFDQLACSVNVPVLNAMFAAPPAEPAASGSSSHRLGCV